VFGNDALASVVFTRHIDSSAFVLYWIGALTMRRQHLALVLASDVSKRGAEAYSFDKLRMQKAVFLVSMRGTQRLQELYSFVPYNWGPYSSRLAMDVDDLVRDNEIAVKAPVRGGYGWYETTLKGETDASAVWATLTTGERDFLKNIRHYVTNRSFTDLLREVYAAYPDFATRSKFSG
jgi:uncharacterized protein YwgA